VAEAICQVGPLGVRAAKEDIDTGVTLALNHPMGPLALTDLLGIDVICFIAKAMYEETKDPPIYYTYPDE